MHTLLVLLPQHLQLFPDLRQSRLLLIKSLLRRREGSGSFVATRLLRLNRSVDPGVVIQREHPLAHRPTGDRDAFDVFRMEVRLAREAFQPRVHAVAEAVHVEANEPFQETRIGEDLLGVRPVGLFLQNGAHGGHDGHHHRRGFGVDADFGDVRFIERV